MKFAKAVLGLLLLLPCSAGYAQDTATEGIRSFWSGNDLYEWCSKAAPTSGQGDINSTACRMYVVGVVDAVSSISATQNIAACFPFLASRCSRFKTWSQSISEMSLKVATTPRTHKSW
jgi:hypothetical protein